MSEKVSRELSQSITAVTSGQSRTRDDLDRGFNFATMLDELIERFGPGDLTLVEHEAMVAHLLNTAIEWDKARNRAKRAASSAEQVDGRGPGTPQYSGPA